MPDVPKGGRIVPAPHPEIALIGLPWISALSDTLISRPFQALDETVCGMHALTMPGIPKNVPAPTPMDIRVTEGTADGPVVWTYSPSKQQYTANLLKTSYALIRAPEGNWVTPELFPPPQNTKQTVKTVVDKESGVKTISIVGLCWGNKMAVTYQCFPPNHKSISDKNKNIVLSKVLRGGVFGGVSIPPFILYRKQNSNQLFFRPEDLTVSGANDALHYAAKTTLLTLVPSTGLVKTANIEIHELKMVENPTSGKKTPSDEIIQRLFFNRIPAA